MEISVMMKCVMDVLTSMEATNHRWLLSTSSVAGVTEFCGLLLVSAGTAGLLCWALQPCRRALSLVLTLLFPAAYLHRRPQPPTQPRQTSFLRNTSTSNWSLLHLQAPLPWRVSSHSGNPYSENRLQALPPAWSRGKGRNSFYITPFPLSFLPLPLNHPSMLFKHDL